MICSIAVRAATNSDPYVAVSTVDCRLEYHHHQSQRIIGIKATLNLHYTNPIVLGESLNTPHTAAALDRRTGDVARMNYKVRGPNENQRLKHRGRLQDHTPQSSDQDC